MSNKKKETQFGNCIHCQEYALLDGEGQCNSCSNHVLDLLDQAVQLTQKEPEITAEQIAHQLEIPQEKVDDWIRKGKLRCVVVRYKCPTCEREFVNQLKCSYCGNTADEHRVKSEASNYQSSIMELLLDDRFSYDRKRLSYRWRLLESLPGYIRND